MQTPPPIYEHRSKKLGAHTCTQSARKVEASFSKCSDIALEARLLDRLIGDKISELFAEQHHPGKACKGKAL
jgi:arginine/lysine/ornithine decarboxylase